MPPVPYVQCLVCGRMTPIDRGVCYHCHSPLPSNVAIPPGMIVCPNCLKLTPIDTGYCRHCRAPLPTIHQQTSQPTNNQPPSTGYTITSPAISEGPRVPQRPLKYGVGVIGRVYTIGPISLDSISPRRLRIVGGTR